MSVLIRREHGPWIRAETASYTSEVEFQDLVERTFDLVLGTQSDAPAIIARELRTPLGGAVDIVAVDVHGVITLCECKLASNAEARRSVLGQLLEYAGDLAGLAWGDFRTRLASRLQGDPVTVMSERAGDAWMGEAEWIEAIGESLAAGRFRLVVAVNEISDALRETVLYLNARADFQILAVELRRAQIDGVEVLAPNVFGDESALRSSRPRRSRPSSRGHRCRRGDRRVGRVPRYERVHLPAEALVSSGADPPRLLRQPQDRAALPAIVHRRLDVPFTPEHAVDLRASGDAIDASVAGVIDRAIARDDVQPRTGHPFQVFILDQATGFELPAPIRHEGRAAWLRGQRYARTDALLTNPDTTEQLAAAGG